MSFFILLLFPAVGPSHVSHHGAAEEGDPWEAVDREAPPAAGHHLADEAQHGEPAGARGGERVLDQPALHDRRAGVLPRGRAPRPELAQNQGEQFHKVS